MGSALDGGHSQCTFNHVLCNRFSDQGDGVTSRGVLRSSGLRFRLDKGPDVRTNVSEKVPHLLRTWAGSTSK